MRVLLIRHGQSGNNVLAETDGHDYEKYMASRTHDPLLSAIGERQAELLAEHFVAAGERLAAIAPSHVWMAHDLPIDTLYVSPMIRALQTAWPLSRALGLTPQVWVDIHEHGGLFTGSPTKNNVVANPGITNAEIAERFPGYAVGAGIDERGWWYGGYEEIELCYTRACGVVARLRELAAEQPGSGIALVTHGTFLDALFHALLMPDAAFDGRTHFSTLNTSLSRVDFLADGRVALRYLNRVDHLPPELVTR